MVVFVLERVGDGAREFFRGEMMVRETSCGFWYVERIAGEVDVWLS